MNVSCKIGHLGESASLSSDIMCCPPWAYCCKVHITSHYTQRGFVRGFEPRCAQLKLETSKGFRFGLNLPS